MLSWSDSSYKVLALEADTLLLLLAEVSNSFSSVGWMRFDLVDGRHNLKLTFNKFSISSNQCHIISIGPCNA